MTQLDRDRLVTLKQARKRQITQEQASEQMGVSQRHTRRLLKRLKSEGDKAAIRGLRLRIFHRKRGEKEGEGIVRILSQEVYHGFRPTLAAECLAERHKIQIGREALLWQGRKRQVECKASTPEFHQQPQGIA